MTKKPNNNLMDFLFIVVFSILIFFGALFVFSEIRKPKENVQISVRSLENAINSKVNKRIRKLEGKKIFLKSKINDTSGLKEDYETVDDSKASSSKLDLEIFEKNDVEELRPKNRSIYDEVMEEASYEDGNNTEQELLLDGYKQQLIQRAREEGWEIEVDDNLEITKQVRLKK